MKIIRKKKKYKKSVKTLNSNYIFLYKWESITFFFLITINLLKNQTKKKTKKIVF